MGAGASVIPEDGVSKDQAKAFFNDAFDEAKFDELAGVRQSYPSSSLNRVHPTNAFLFIFL